MKYLKYLKSEYGGMTLRQMIKWWWFKTFDKEGYDKYCQDTADAWNYDGQFQDVRYTIKILRDENGKPIEMEKVTTIL
jgi:hypothetical protein